MQYFDFLMAQRHFTDLRLEAQLRDNGFTYCAKGFTGDEITATAESDSTLEEVLSELLEQKTLPKTYQLTRYLRCHPQGSITLSLRENEQRLIDFEMHDCTIFLTHKDGEKRYDDAYNIIKRVK